MMTTMKVKIIVTCFDLIAVCVCLKFMADGNFTIASSAATFLFGRCLYMTMTQE